MKQFLSVLVLTFFVSNAAFASFPVKSSSKTNESAAEAPGKETQKQSTNSDAEASKVNQNTEKRGSKAQAKFQKKIEKIQAKLDQKSPNGDDTTVAIILAVVSVLIFPFGLHNWYLGRKKQALWQTLLVIPGFILIVPPLISWVWQIVDLIRLIANGELPS